MVIAYCRLSGLRRCLGGVHPPLRGTQIVQRRWYLRLCEQHLPGHEHACSFHLRVVRGDRFFMALFPRCTILPQVLYLGHGNLKYRSRHRHWYLLYHAQTVWRWDRVPALRGIRDHLLYKLDPAHPVYGVHAAHCNGCGQGPRTSVFGERAGRNRHSGIRGVVLGHVGCNLHCIRTEQLLIQPGSRAKPILQRRWLQSRSSHWAGSLCHLRHVLVQRMDQEHGAHDGGRNLRLMVLLHRRPGPDVVGRAPEL